MKMRDLIAIASRLHEATIPATRYGYWVTRDGEVLAVPTLRHSEIAVENGIADSDSALKQGWIRIVARDDCRPGEFCVNFVQGFPSRRAVSSLRRLVSQIDADAYVLHFHGIAGSRRFADRRDFVEAIMAGASATPHSFGN